jgi:hypothetical protein
LPLSTLLERMLRQRRRGGHEAKKEHGRESTHRAVHSWR